MLGGVGGGSFGDGLTAWVGDRRESGTGQRLSVFIISTSENGSRANKGASSASGSLLSLSVSAFCLSVIVGATLSPSLLYFYWSGCGFSKASTLNAMCDVMV